MASPGVVQGQTRVSQDWLRWYWGVGLVVVLCMFCSDGRAQSPGRPTGELTVFAAASLTEPFTEIGKRLEVAHIGLKIIYNFGGSPTLRTQIEQGARAEVFVSADMAQMELAKKNGMVQGETPVFVKNRLVVIVPRSNPGQVTTFRDLAKPGLKLTLAAPKVPVGTTVVRPLAEPILHMERISRNVSYATSFPKKKTSSRWRLRCNSVRQTPAWSTCRMLRPRSVKRC